jgi:hypothetical protein
MAAALLNSYDDEDYSQRGLEPDVIIYNEPPLGYGARGASRTATLASVSPPAASSRASPTATPSVRPPLTLQVSCDTGVPSIRVQ